MMPGLSPIVEARASQTLALAKAKSRAIASKDSQRPALPLPTAKTELDLRQPSASAKAGLGVLSSRPAIDLYVPPHSRLRSDAPAAPALASRLSRTAAGAGTGTDRYVPPHSRADYKYSYPMAPPTHSRAGADRYTPAHSRSGYAAGNTTSTRSRAPYGRAQAQRRGSAELFMNDNCNGTSYASDESGAGSGFGSSSTAGGEELREMKPRGYVQAVQNLMGRLLDKAEGEGEPSRSGSLENPKVHWLRSATGKGISDSRRAEIESICYDVCIKYNVSNAWIRCVDHNQTRVLTKTATGVVGVIKPDDPHITAHLGTTTQYEFDAHIYVAYNNGSMRLAREDERITINPDGTKKALSILDRRNLRRDARKWGWLPDPEGSSGSGSWRTQAQTHSDAIVVADAEAGIGFRDVAPAPILKLETSIAGLTSRTGDCSLDTAKLRTPATATNTSRTPVAG